MARPPGVFIRLRNPQRLRCLWAKIFRPAIPIVPPPCYDAVWLTAKTAKSAKKKTGLATDKDTEALVGPSLRPGPPRAAARRAIVGIHAARVASNPWHPADKAAGTPGCQNTGGRATSATPPLFHGTFCGST
jgi:hypothetical protein